MKEQSILNLAEKNGYNVAYKRYEYWDNVLHLNNTAICFNELIMNNGFTITAETGKFPCFCYNGIHQRMCREQLQMSRNH